MTDTVLKKTNAALLHRIGFKGGQQVIALISGIILARILTPYEFGVVAIANIIIHYANNFTNFGLNNALVQKKEIQSAHINTVFTIDLMISCILIGITVFFAGKIAIFFHNPAVGPVLRWMSLYYVITTFYYIPVVILRRSIDFRFITVVELVETIFSAALSIFLALAGLSYWSIVITSLCVPTVITVVFMLKTKWAPRFAFERNMGDLYSFGLWNFIRAQVQLLVAKIDYFVIGRYLNAHALGIYEKSFELTERGMTGLTTPVNTIFFSTFSRLQDDIPRIRQVFLEASSLLVLISCPVLLGLISITPHFVKSCFGSKWIHMIVPVQILAAASLFRVLLGLVASLNVAIGKYKIHTILNSSCAVLYILLCFLAVSYGIIAICTVFFVYSVMSFIGGFWIIKRNVDIRVVDLIKALWCPIAGSLLMLVTVLLLRSMFFLNTSSLFELFFLISAGGTVYFVWSLFFYKKGYISLRIHSGKDGI